MNHRWTEYKPPESISALKFGNTNIIKNNFNDLDQREEGYTAKPMFDNWAFRKDSLPSQDEETENVMEMEERNDVQPMILAVENHEKSIPNKRKNATSMEEIPTRSNQLDKKKRFQCTQCDHSTDKKGNLNRHIRTHSGEKPYRCDICRKAFTCMQNLKRHKSTHANEFPFHCRICLNGFDQKIEKEAHENVCQSRRYECHICKQFSTMIKTQMKMHMRTHNGEKPFRCGICKKRYAVKSNLKKHQKITHAGINP